MGANEYKIEYAVRIPEQKQQEFIDWMAAARETPMTIYAQSYGHESAYRLTNEDGREVGELYQKFSMAP